MARRRIRQSPFLSNPVASVGRGIPLKPACGAGIELFMATRNYLKNLAAMIYALAAQAAGFKKCCLQSSRFRR